MQRVRDVIGKFKKTPMERFEEILKEYQIRTSRLEELKEELGSLNSDGFGQELSSIVSRLQVPGGLARAEAEISSLIKRIERQRERERKEIKNLFSTTKSLIKKAILTTRRPEILAGLKILEVELLNSLQEFEAEETSYEEAKAMILSFQEQAEILNIPISKEEERLKETYYEILDISPEANQEEIKQRYHQKTKEYHPDSQSPGSKEWVKKQAEEMMKKITEAYKVLSNPAKRREYDLKIGIRM